MFKDGGWWHDSTLLSSIGEGAEKEEQKAWAAWWNEQIVRYLVSKVDVEKVDIYRLN